MFRKPEWFTLTRKRVVLSNWPCHSSYSPEDGSSASSRNFGDVHSEYWTESPETKKSPK